jgi:hypothetical protein
MRKIKVEEIIFKGKILVYNKINKNNNMEGLMLYFKKKKIKQFKTLNNTLVLKKNLILIINLVLQVLSLSLFKNNEEFKYKFEKILLN